MVKQLQIIVLILSLIIGISYSQEIDLELMLDNEMESDDNVDLLVFLQDLQKHPFNLNTVTIQELESIPWISSKTARDIINYRKKWGDFTSVASLLKVKSVDAEMFFIIKE